MKPSKGLKSLLCFGGNSHQKSEDPYLPPLRPVTFPKVLPIHQSTLAEQGWTTVTYDSTDTLHNASDALLHASKAFFAQPATYKQSFKVPDDSGDGSDGWSRVEGEKELLTLRSINSVPPELKDAVAAYWTLAGGLLNETLGRVAESLGLPADSLTVYSSPSKEMGSLRTATMLRLFRYEGFEGTQSKVVAEGKLPFLILNRQAC